MAGRIRDEDIALVRERSPIAEVVEEHVTLRGAGSGSLKGLCPFHEEKSPSFHVTPSRGYYHCFGCGEGGDVISFVMSIDHLTFAEAVERLAGRAGVELRYEQGGSSPRPQQGQRTRLVDAHRQAAEFYAEKLNGSGQDSEVARRFLAERGFDAAAAERFGVGFSPRGWDELVSHLRGRGFTPIELLAAGLAREGRQGPIDRFTGRLMWPIREITGDVVGFGARRLFDDDRVEAKYLNTADTPIYKKSSVLYGLDLAKKAIRQRTQAVVVEGYTDVMACHLAGVETAVATCGTAFGEEHIKVLRRVLMDSNEARGEVVFTFDGDAAGQKAALRAFEEDQRWVSQTFVAVEPSGLDPCDLRLKSGDAAVRDLVARRVPMFEFAIRAVLRRHDLDTAEGRVAALREAAPLVGRIRDRSLRPEYARQLAGWLGMEVEPVASAVGAAERNPGRPSDANRREPSRQGAVDKSSAAAPVARFRPDPRDPVMQVEREVLKLAVQSPELVGSGLERLGPEAFTAAPYASVRRAVGAAGGGAEMRGGPVWVGAVRDHAADDAVRALVTELAVEPLRTDEPDARYSDSLLARLGELAATRRAVEVKSKLQRLNPVESVTEYNRLFGELVALEAHRRELRERASGGV